MKKPLAAAALALAALGALAVPAGAAVPTRAPSFTVACTGGAARVWTAGAKLAADNPCSTWLWLPDPGGYASGAPYFALDVAPGAHFSWSRSETRRYAVAGLPMWGSPHPGELSADGTCVQNSATTYTVIRSYKDVTTPGEC